MTLCAVRMIGTQPAAKAMRLPWNCESEVEQLETKVYSRSPEPQELCRMRIAMNYTLLSMAYYVYDSTANF